MSSGSLLLRLLLCLSLLLNSVASAAVGTRMLAAHSQVLAAAGPARHVMPAAMAGAASMPPCHRHDAPALAPAAHPGAPACAATVDHRQAMPDCCKAGTCDGACSLTPVALNHPSLLPAPGHAVVLPALASPRPDPTARPAIRPPIG